MAWYKSNLQDTELLDKRLDGSITEINSNVTSMTKYACYDCDSLLSVNLPEALTLREDCFNGCAYLASVSIPKVTYIGYRCFSGCTRLSSVSMPSAEYITASAFVNCSSLVSVVLPSAVTLLDASAFSGCTSLELLDINLQGNFSNCVAGCSNLSTIVLRANSVAPLAAVKAFNNTPFASSGSGGTLYVPQALISSYQSANNWSTILGYTNNQILAIEGSIYE